MASRLWSAVLWLSVSLVVSWPAAAKKADRLQPINTTAKSTSAYNLPNSVTTLIGAVKVTQGTMVVTGDVARLYFDADQQISHIVVKGHPAHFQELDEQDRLVSGDADSLDYDNVNHIAALTTGAIVTIEGQGNVHGDRLTYNLDTTAMHAESTDEGFVTGTILPKQKNTAPNRLPSTNHP